MTSATDPERERRLENYGIICKIWFGYESEVFNKIEYPDQEDYRDLMRTGQWKYKYGCKEVDQWEWGTPRDYMKNGRVKLLLYDGVERAITVDCNVLPDSFYICEDDSEEGESDEDTDEEYYGFPYRNVIEEISVKVLDKVIPLDRIRSLPGFDKVGIKGDRNAFRLISRQDYYYLIR